MASIPVMCLICNKSVKDSMFPQHMQFVHSGMTQSEAIATEKNMPNPQIPIVLDKDAPPSDDFMEVAKMLDKPKDVPPVPSPVKKTPARSVPSAQEERKPKEIKLEYKYSGECADCLIPVETLVVKVKGQTVTVAFCTKHGQLKEREVADLEEKPFLIPTTRAEKELTKKEAEELLKKELSPATLNRINLIAKQHKEFQKKRGVKKAYE